jgi:hypothetical protein
MNGSASSFALPSGNWNTPFGVEETAFRLRPYGSG